MRRMALFLSAGITIFALACGSSDDVPTVVPTPLTGALRTELPPVSGPVIKIVIDDFIHTDVEIEVGATVIWTNDDKIGQHTVTHRPTNADDAVDFDSGGDDPNRDDPAGQAVRLRRGESFQFTFTEPGAYPYICLIHPVNMKATVTVVEKSG